MPSEKQIDALTSPIERLDYRTPREVFDIMCARIITAAEQAEPAPPPDDSLSAVISSIGNEIHNLACERQNDEDLSERLSDFRDRLWAIAQRAPIEPAPAARSGAVKVVEDTYERYPKIMDRLAALEPAEPATDADPVAWGEDIGGKIVSVRMDKSRHCTVPLYTRPPESRLREALEEIANLKPERDRSDDYNRGFADGRWQAVKIARAALAQEDGR